MKSPKKFSDTSTRVLETLKILAKDNASINDIIKHFEKIDPNNRIYTNEVILKYINTLKVFGLKFIKQKDKYVLLNQPLQFDFTKKELETIYLLEKSVSLIPEERIQEETHKFLQELEKRFSEGTKMLAHNVIQPKMINLEFSYDKYAKEIKEYEKYCIEGQKLKIIYKDANKSDISIVAEPNEIRYKKHNVYLSIYNPLSAQIQDIDFDDIIEIKQLPLRTNPTNLLSTATFILKGPLAKSYTIHKEERLLQVKPDGSIVLLNQKEDKTALLRRLMRYGANCEIISPKSLREEMIKMVDSTLKNYI